MDAFNTNFPSISISASPPRFYESLSPYSAAPNLF
jgi:hypothetical protein